MKGSSLSISCRKRQIWLYEHLFISQCLQIDEVGFCLFGLDLADEVDLRLYGLEVVDDVELCVPGVGASVCFLRSSISFSRQETCDGAEEQIVEIVQFHLKILLNFLLEELFHWGIVDSSWHFDTL